MTKLKTLKDLETVNGFISYRKARDLAIKWVKDWVDYGNNDWFAGKIEAFMDFFNITEDDLKC